MLKQVLHVIMQLYNRLHSNKKNLYFSQKLLFHDKVQRNTIHKSWARCIEELMWVATIL